MQNVYRIQTIKSPISGTLRGYRPLVAVANNAGPKGNTLFSKAYIIYIGSDFTSFAEVAAKLEQLVKEFK